MIHVIHGAPCSGKSTYVREHAGEEDVRVDFDILAQALGAPISHGSTGAQWKAALAARQAVIDGLIDGELSGVEAWIIQTTLSPQVRERYEKAGAEIVVMDTSLEECLDRCAADGRPEGTEDRIREWFEKNPTETAKRGGFSFEKGDAVQRKTTVEFKLKSGTDEELAEGVFTAYASVFGNVDSYGDVVMPGAFTKTLEEWENSGANIPILFGHVMDDPDFNIGHVVSAEQDEHGLKVVGQLDLESPKGKQVHRLLKGRRINQMSFAYDVEKTAWGEIDGEQVLELHELKLYEVSIVTVGANQATEILDVKSGRVLAQKHIDSLRSAQESIAAVIAAAESSLEEPKASKRSASTPEEPAGVKGKEKLEVLPVEKLSLEIALAELS